jgi:hypothetical protein
LSTSARCWEPEVRNAPAFVSLDPAGHYEIWSGDPYTNSPTLVLETEDPVQAAAELERQLAAWA